MSARSKWLLKFAFDGALVGCVFAVVSGGYNKALDWEARRVIVTVDPSRDIVDAAAKLNAEDFRQIECIARNQYFEARSQGAAGMRAVTDVVFNRVKSGLFPDQACQVITQYNPVTGVAQFSWVHDGRDHTIHDQAAWKLSYQIAYNEWLYREKMPDTTGGAIRYHADYVQPKWRNFVQTTQIGLHKFFKPAQSTAKGG